jgi:hypothetical protein
MVNASSGKTVDIRINNATQMTVYDSQIRVDKQFLIMNGGLFLCRNGNPLATWWFFHDTATDNGDGIGNLIFYCQDNAGDTSVTAIVWFEDDVGAGNKKMNFTASHRCRGGTIDGDTDVGLIVVANGKYDGLITNKKDNPLPKDEIEIDEALPVVKLSSKRKQKNVFGVVCCKEQKRTENGKDFRYWETGAMRSQYKIRAGDNRVEVNAVGEGAIWCVNTNGNFQNGDLIQTSPIAGYGEKQNEDYIANYTCAKITCDIDFADPDLATNYETRTVLLDTVEYKAVFVGCVYKF